LPRQKAKSAKSAKSSPVLTQNELNLIRFKKLFAFFAEEKIKKF
jgi:hypothetical protein